jgi:hypothetical protein
MGGHGKAGSGVVYWGTEDNQLTAETAAGHTAKRWSDCTGVSIKVYSCYSAEGGFDSFANRFARAFRPVGGTYEVTIFGYRGLISPRPQALNAFNVEDSKKIDFYRKHFTIPEYYTGPTESVVPGISHRWSKINISMFHGRASEARDEVARVEGLKRNRRLSQRRRSIRGAPRLITFLAERARHTPFMHLSMLRPRLPSQTWRTTRGSSGPLVLTFSTRP